MKKEDPVVLRVSHRFSASAERVYDAWLDPDKACKFLFATPTGQMVRFEIDPRVGGGFTIVERRAGEEVAHVGKYVELDRPRRIVFSISVPKYSPDAHEVRVDIQPLSKGCEVTITQEMPSMPPDMQRRALEGWRGILELAAELVVDAEPTCGAGLAQHSSVPSRIADLLGALAETLEQHREMLDLADGSSRAEDEAYARLAGDFRKIAGETADAAARMAGYRDLPMGVHRAEAFGAAQLDSFRRFVSAQGRLLGLLRLAAERDAKMLSSIEAPR